jgi:hypothetical protein
MAVALSFGTSNGNASITPDSRCAHCECSLNGNDLKKQFLSLCPAQISLQDDPDLEGSGDGVRSGPGSHAHEDRPRFYYDLDFNDREIIGLAKAACG